jgi:hypothetical protein
MRERCSSDWVVDLQGRHGVEAEVEHALLAHPTLRLLRSSTRSFDRLDFQLLAPDERLVELEVKSKRQPLSADWRALRPEVDPKDLFVLDELALRKIIDAGRFAFLLVYDVPRARWLLWSVGDLLVASRVRHTRYLRKSEVMTRKGKLVLDLNEAGCATRDVHGALDVLVRSVAQLETWWVDIRPWPIAGAVL